MKKKFLILAAFCVIYLQACNDEKSVNEIEYQLPPTSQPTAKIRYTVEGGGQIDFIIENKADSLSVIVLSFQFKARNDTFVISKSEIDRSDREILESTFKGAIDIGGIIYRNELLTGTWTYLYIEYNDNWLRIANETIRAELRSLYVLVSGMMVAR